MVEVGCTITFDIHIGNKFFPAKLTVGVPESSRSFSLRQLFAGAEADRKIAGFIGNQFIKVVLRAVCMLPEFREFNFFEF